MLRRFFYRGVASASKTLTLVLAGACALALAYADSAAANAAGARANANANASKALDAPQKVVSSYSKTSEFARRLQLLEFTEKADSKSKRLAPLLDEMRRKNYPIQRVDRKDGGEEIYRKFDVRSVPSFVLLFDGKEIGRIDAKKDDPRVARDKLLKLFQKGRDAVAANPRIAEKEPEFKTPAKPKFGFLFPNAKRATLERAQAKDAASDPNFPQLAEDLSILDARAEELSRIIGEGRLNAAATRVEVEAPDGGASRVGAGVVVHYNAQYQEALVATAAALFVGIDDAVNNARVVVDVFSTETQKSETKGAQCVYCDLDAGLAFVAAQVDHPATPAAFLPKKSPLEIGERACSVARDGDGFVKTLHDVLSVDQRRFYQTSSEVEQNASFLGIEVSNAPEDGALGAGLFVERNERYYLAGLCLSTNDNRECFVAPIALASRSLLVNRNLAAVYRDQIAGKFDAAASDAEIDVAVSRLVKLDADRRAQKQRDALELPAQQDGVKKEEIALAPAKPDLAADDARLDLEGNAPNFDADARADAAVANLQFADAPNAPVFPATAADAFAQSDAVANVVAAQPQNVAAVNDGFKIAQDAQESGATTNQSLAIAQDPNPNAILQAPAIVSENLKETLVDANHQANATNATSATSASVAQARSASIDDVGAPIVADSASSAPNNVANEKSSPYAPALATTNANSDAIRSASFGDLPDLAALETFDREEELFETAVDALRRRSLEGAEIICIVNWNSDPNSPRESEVVRLPVRTMLENPRNVRPGVELVERPAARTNANPAAAQGAARTDAPLVSTLPDAKVVK